MIKIISTPFKERSHTLPYLLEKERERARERERRIKIWKERGGLVQRKIFCCFWLLPHAEVNHHKRSYLGHAEIKTCQIISMHTDQHIQLRKIIKNWKSLTISTFNIYDRLASLQNLCHYKSLTPSKSMPPKSNHYFKEKYTYVHVGTLVSMCSSENLAKNWCFSFEAAF